MIVPDGIKVHHPPFGKIKEKIISLPPIGKVNQPDGWYYVGQGQSIDIGYYVEDVITAVDDMPSVYAYRKGVLVRIYWQNGYNIHRIGGPAIIMLSNGNSMFEYLIDNRNYSEQDYWNHPKIKNNPVVLAKRMDNILNDDL